MAHANDKFRLLFFVLLGMASAAIAADKSSTEKPAFELHDPGTSAIVDYEKYGTLTNITTPQYRYVINDRAALAAALGEGIYPNTSGLTKDPAYQKAEANKELEGSVWDYTNSDDVQLDFFKWASNHDQPAGMRQFYVAQLLEKAHLLTQAIKSYQAVVVQFPKEVGKTFWKTPWYAGPAALDAIAYLTRTHPQLGMRLKGGRIRIDNRYDDNPNNDVFYIDPGKIVPFKGKIDTRHKDLSGAPIKQQLGHGTVHLVQYQTGDWQLIVDGKPYVLRGIAYSAPPVGKSPDDKSLVVHKDWMLADENKNGKIDGPYDSWIDKNRNNRQDPDEPVVGDFELLKQMGVNTIRLYHHGYNKALLSDLYKTYGIRVIMGDYLGGYAVGSGADWNAGTDYSNPQQQQNMLASVRQMVEEYKDEPYIVFWVLGNENNYGVANNSRQNPEAYYQFLDKAAAMIKSIDPNHPVALCNGDVLFMDKAAKFCSHVDIFGANAYRGNHGFGDSFWRDLADIWKKPVFISEYGCPAYNYHKSEKIADGEQAEYLRSDWNDIAFNTAGGAGVGNAVGGVLFEWLDEWWKAGPPPQYDASIHDIVGQFSGPFPDVWSYEEWYGVASQGDGKHSPYERQLRDAYYMYKNDLWDAKNLKRQGLPQ